MVDSTRKGKTLWCYNCKKPTRHVADSEPKEKLVWWICEDCGKSKLQDNWS